MEATRDIKFLVVDDSTTNAVLLEAILDEKGYKVEIALNVHEARTLIDRDKPDIILLDLLMPNITGFDFLKELKSSDYTKDIDVFIVSALSDEENVNHTLKLGALWFFKKPIDLQEMVDSLEEIIEWGNYNFLRKRIAIFKRELKNAKKEIIESLKRRIYILENNL